MAALDRARQRFGNGCPSGLPVPVAQHRLHQRQSRNRRGIGPHDARSQRNGGDEGKRRQQRLLLRREAALRARSARRRAACSGFSASSGLAIAAVSSQWTSARPGSQSCKHLRQASPAPSTSGTKTRLHCSAASTTLAFMRSMFTRSAMVRWVMTGRSRRGPQLGCLLHHIIEPGMFQRREAIIDVGRQASRQRPDAPRAGSRPSW